MQSMKVRAFKLFTGIPAAVAVAACSKDAARQSATRSSAPIDTAVVATQAPTPSAGRPRSLAGLAYTSLPSGVSFISGAAIPVSSGAPTFDVAHVKTPDGDHAWLQTAGPKIGGTASHLVIADLTLPPMSSTESLVMASCDVNGKLDPTVIAIVTNEPNAKQLTKVRQAWRANTDAKRFDMIPVDGVVCEEPDAAE
ncbi:MAG TPA: hypothetical protein VHB25_18410 [Gemmatimonadaceae bacterium]|nr:hypothetical protein [Gemmatimonadaceae bacterium]